MGEQACSNYILSTKVALICKGTEWLEAYKQKKLYQANGKNKKAEGKGYIIIR